MDEHETIQELITHYKDYVFDIFWNIICVDTEAEFQKYKTIWSERTDDISWSMIANVLIDRICPHCAKKFVEQYGEDEGESEGESESEDAFYKRLLHRILFSNGITTTYQDYETYCEANPYESESEDEEN
jgi:hypothetical protein|nr:MAG: hypothetical protein [Lake Baikal virophage 12]